MKFSCTQENLISGLNLVSHVAGRSASLPILSNILLRTTKSGLELVATNLEVAVITTVRGKVEADGAITVQGRLIADVVGLFPHERVDVSLEGTTLTLVCGKQRTTMHGMTVDEFPVIPEVEQGSSTVLVATDLEATLSQVVFAVNAEESRPEISGVYFEQSSRGVVVVGTDSYRLAERIVETTTQTTDRRMIVPLRTVQEVARVAGASKDVGEVEVISNDTQVVWKFGETKVVSRLVAGQYPDYQQLIPKEFSTSATIQRDDLIRAVRAAGLFVRAGVNDVRLVIDPQSSLLRVASANSQLGENQTEVNITKATGELVEITFNYRYLLEGLQAMRESEVSIELVNDKRPGVFKPVGNQSYLYIIMPIRQ